MDLQESAIGQNEPATGPSVKNAQSMFEKTLVATEVSTTLSAGAGEMPKQLPPPTQRAGLGIASRRIGPQEQKPLQSLSSSNVVLHFDIQCGYQSKALDRHNPQSQLQLQSATKSKQHSAASIDPCKDRVAYRVLKHCKHIAGSTKPCIYMLDIKPHKKLNKTSMIERYTFGQKPRLKTATEKVLMVVGATGAGKTTLINGIVNYILNFDVKWSDNLRFKMITEKGEEDQTKSMTQKITAYTIYPHEGSPIDYTLTIVDTPGFGDTRGLKRDKEIVGQIQKFFSMSVHDGGVDHLDALGFVTPASLPRLSPTQQYVFDSILSVFGKDVKDNILMMITFADGSDPPVVGAIRKAEVCYQYFFKFNNSAIYSCPDQNTYDSDDDDFDIMFWKMGIKSFKRFFKVFCTIMPQSLQLTTEVLMERQRIEVTIEGLRKRINEGLSRINELHKENQILMAHEADIETNRKFTYTITITKYIQKD